jgi:hypothetical protein
MELLLNSRFNSFRGTRLSPALLFMFLVLSAMLLIACNPFSNPFNGDDDEAPSEQLSEEPSEPAEPELAEVGLERVLAGVERQAVETDTAPTVGPEPSPTQQKPQHPW